MAVTIILGDLRQAATVSNPGAQVPDGGGGYVLEYAQAGPGWRCQIEKATVRAAERHFAAAVIAKATHVLSGRYNPNIISKSRIAWTDRNGEAHSAEVLDVDDTEGQGVETVALVTEIAR